MEDWLVNLIIGLASAVLGFIGGFFTKTYSVKSKQKNKRKQQSAKYRKCEQWKRKMNKK